MAKKIKKILVFGLKKKNSSYWVKSFQWIAYHGCSININNNLNHYKKIIPCGLDNNKITSIYNEKKLCP